MTFTIGSEDIRDDHYYDLETFGVKGVVKPESQKYYLDENGSEVVIPPGIIGSPFGAGGTGLF